MIRNSKTMQKIRALITAGFVLASGAAMAAPDNDAFNKVNETFDWILAGLLGVAVVGCSIAFVQVGYKFMYRGEAWADVQTKAIGGILIGAAGGLGSYLVS